MSAVQTPPQPSEVDNDTEAGVIDDARARQNKQRRAGVAVALAAVIAAGLLLAFGGSGGRSGGGHVGNGNGGESGGFASHTVIAAPGAATSAEIAAALSSCGSPGGYPTYPPEQRVVLAQASARYTALITIAGGHAYQCLYGHMGTVHAYDWEDLGLTGVAPAADKLSARVSFRAGAGSFPGQFQISHSEAWRRSKAAIRFRRRFRRHWTRAEFDLASRRSAGLGFGDYALGQAGKAITAVSVRLPNGTIVDATVQHGWYFVWWRGFTNPTAIQVMTKSKTESSPMTTIRRSSPLAGPGCKPGTSGCVFERT